MPSLVLANRFIIGPFMLMSSKSLGFRNIQPRVLYLLHASAGQSHTTCTLSNPHSQQSCHCVSLSLNIRALWVVWPINSPTAALSIGPLIPSRSFVLLGRESLTSVLDWWQPLQVFHTSAPVLKDS
jgi:hypothetical protein